MSCKRPRDVCANPTSTMHIGMHTVDADALGSQPCDKAGTINVVASPGAVCIGTQQVERPHAACTRGDVIRVLQRSNFVRHGEHQAIDVFQAFETGDGRIDPLWLDMRRQEHRVDAVSFEQGAPHHRCAHVIDRVSEDGEQARAGIQWRVEAGALAGLEGTHGDAARCACVSRNRRAAAPHKRPRSTGESAAYARLGASTPIGTPGGSASSRAVSGSVPSLAPG